MASWPAVDLVTANRRRLRQDGGNHRQIRKWRFIQGAHLRQPAAVVLVLALVGVCVFA